ncbi:VOC family protein, partial [Kitasatospora sp. NPDC047058]|uniref:VOC family protein n=1 Tax=Kitasatospora sp. NPDC047058 TaxID=3155620 RepID=UPI0034099DC9
MASLVRHVTIDCTDVFRLAQFWAGVLDSKVSDDDNPGDRGGEVAVGEGVPRGAVPAVAAGGDHPGGPG